MWGTSSSEEKLAGDPGNVIEATSIGGRRSDFFTAGKLAPGNFGLLQQYRLAAGGIDPDKDIATIVVPPPQMVANMKVGNMDAFCVGEPWNEQLVNQGIGFTACTTGEIWGKHPEKALGIRAEWADKIGRAYGR